MKKKAILLLVVLIACAAGIAQAQEDTLSGTLWAYQLTDNPNNRAYMGFLDGQIYRAGLSIEIPTDNGSIPIAFRLPPAPFFGPVTKPKWSYDLSEDGSFWSLEVYLAARVVILTVGLRTDPSATEMPVMELWMVGPWGGLPPLPFAKLRFYSLFDAQWTPPDA